MAKIDIEQVELILKKAGIPKTKVTELVSEITEAAAILAGPSTRGRGPRKEFVLVVSDPEKKLKGLELVGWAVQIDEGVPVATTVEKVERALINFGQTKRGRKLRLKSIGEGFELASTKSFKEAGIYRKHKEAVFVVFTDNVIPVDKGE